MAQINDALNTNACRLFQAPAAVQKVGVASRQRCWEWAWPAGPRNEWQCTSWPAGVSHLRLTILCVVASAELIRLIRLVLELHLHGVTF